MNPFGANWKTTVTGGLQAIFSAVVTGSLVFPSNWSDPKQDALFGCVVIGTLLGIQFGMQAKAKEVTGGSVQQTLDGSKAQIGTQTLVDITKDSTPAK